MSLRYVLIALTLMISVAGFTSFHTAAKRDAEKSEANAKAMNRRYRETHLPTYADLFPTSTGQNAYEDYARCENDLAAHDAFRYADAVETLRLNKQMKPQQQMSVASWAEGKSIPQLEREATDQYGHEFAFIEQGNMKPCHLPSTMGVDPWQFYPGALLSNFKRTCKLLNLTVDLRLTGAGSDKDTKQATRLLVDEMRFARNFSGIDVLHDFVGVACQSMAYKEIEDNLDRFNADDWSALESEARRELSQGTPMKHALAGQIPEEVRLISDYASTAAGPDPNQGDPSNLPVDGDQPGDRLWQDMHSMSQEQRNLAVVKANGYILREYTVDQHALEKPMSQWPWPGDSQTVSRDPIVGELTAGALDAANLNKNAAQSELRLRLLIVHALIQKYRIRTGHLPATLNDLNATDDIKDPLAGGEFEYEPNGNSYRLYSPGKGLMYPIELTLKPQLYPDIRAKLQAQTQTQTQP